CRVKKDVSNMVYWKDTFMTRTGQKESQKHKIGVSIGTRCVSGLAGELQSRHWMFLNGVVLVSPTGLGLEPEGPAPRSSVLKLPYYTAAAWYHKQLPSDLQSQDLTELLPKVEQYTIEEYLPAL